MSKRKPRFAPLLNFKKLTQPNPVEEILKHMNSDNVERIYDDLIDTDNISKLSYQNIGMFSGRHIIFVTKYDSKSLENGGQLFYKSSGTSRSTGLGGYWLPCNGIEKIEDFSGGYTRLAKPEDIYLHHLPDEGTDIYQNIETYGRFITKENAMISIFLSQVKIPGLLNELITQDDIDTQKMSKPLVVATLSVASSNAAAHSGNAAAPIVTGNAAAHSDNAATNVTGGSKKRIRRKSKRKTRRKSRRKSKRKSKRNSKRKSRK